MTTPAISARSAAKTIFSTATRAVGIGARSRSSISLVKENSITRGKATACTAVMATVSATIPGNNCAA